MNVVPDYSKLWVRVRDSDRAGMTPVYERVMEMAEGAAILANVDYKVTLISGIYEVLVNRRGGEIMQKNLELLGPIEYNSDEIKFAKELQLTLDKPQVGLNGMIYPLRETIINGGGGSTDVGDVSWNVPTAGLRTATWVPGTAAHSWQAVALGATSIGLKGTELAAKVLASSAIEIISNPSIIDLAKAEHISRVGEDFIYNPLLGDRKPPLAYRKIN